MMPFFAIDRRGTVQLTICIGPWALKVARNATGRCCNRFEADLWARTTAARRNMLCPVLARLPFGVGLVMQRAEPLRKDERDRLMDAHGFPDWDYVPPDEGEPFEYKASDWGRLSDGRLVALDYSAPALGSPNKGKSLGKETMTEPTELQKSLVDVPCFSGAVLSPHIVKWSSCLRTYR